MRYLVVALAVVGALIGPSAAAAWTWPTGGPVIRPYSLGPDAYAAGQHRGIDVQGEAGEAVLAPTAGVVSFTGTVPTHGRTVTIQTVAGYAVSLTHLGAVVVARGDAIAEGTTVGAAGSSGDPEWPSVYVHLGIRVGSAADDYVDPMSLLPPRTVLAPPVPTPAPAATPVTAPASASTPPVPTLTVPTPPATTPATVPVVPGGVPVVPAAIPPSAADPIQQSVSETDVAETIPARAPVVGHATAAATTTSAAAGFGSGGASIASHANADRPAGLIRQTPTARSERDVASPKGDRAGMRPAAEGVAPEAVPPMPAATLLQNRIGGAGTAAASRTNRGRPRVDRAATTGRGRLPIDRRGHAPVSGAANLPARSPSTLGHRSAGHPELAGEPVLARILPVALCLLAAVGAAAHVRRRSQRTLLV
jgi:hypothetical protein